MTELCDIGAVELRRRIGSKEVSPVELSELAGVLERFDRIELTGETTWMVGGPDQSVAVSLAMIAAFFAGVPPAEAAIVAGAFLLLTRRIKSEKVYAEIDWTLLLMFAGLFIVVAGLEHSVLSPEVIGAVARLHLERIPVLSGITAILSNIVSNVPAVLVLKPFIAQLQPQQKAWLTVAMASTLAGNFTLVGSVANLIVVQRARAQNVEIGFWEYFKLGAPLTVLTIGIGVLWLELA